MSLQLEHYLILAVILFAIGFFTSVSRRNALAILMGVELMLNAALINFIAFAHFGGNQLEGQIMALFIMVVAAAEVAVALAIVLGIYRRFGAIDVERATTLRK